MTIAEVFAEAHGKPPAVARQIRERLKQHSLLVSTASSSGSLAFDHEDFRAFYLGEALGRMMARHASGELRTLLQAGLLPRAATEEAILYLKRLGVDIPSTVAELQGLAAAETAASMVRENCGALAIGLAAGGVPVRLRGLTFPEDSLRGRALTNLVVHDSYFQASSLAGSRLVGCEFAACRFDRLEIHHDTVISAALENCEVTTLVRIDRDEQLFDPKHINAALAQAGFRLGEGPRAVSTRDLAEPDEEIRLLERVVRIFLRANQVNEDVIRMKLGSKAATFLDRVLPRLLAVGVFEEIPYFGHGSQHRFRMRVRMHKLHDTLVECGGDFQQFLRTIAEA